MMKAIILMTRVPIPGKTKTRLMEVLSPEECAEIHSCFLRDIFGVMGKLEPEIDVYVSYTPEDEFRILSELLPEDVKAFPQHGETLGDRMKHAFEAVFKMGYDEVVLMGSDVPEIDLECLEESFVQLESNDMCVGPTLDGGYYLIGMKEVQSEIFSEDMKWGCNTVLEGTFRQINSQGLSVGLVTKQRDIDTGDDFEYLMNKLGAFEESGTAPRNTIDFLRKYREGGSADEKWARE
ncbi:2-phospho-L-lactate guanylyltransferase [Andreesenia angusta]|uniref:2-phospho-L-lactate guanylyltransferase n=2 Tax=Andreesenia angusta TaxID=39480 RepID=A0A1S1V6W5_9FIRM|nr:2-phospho-L-lactate guanylyltransferase [Andreesenia angusta]